MATEVVVAAVKIYQQDLLVNFYGVILTLPNPTYPTNPNNPKFWRCAAWLLRDGGKIVGLTDSDQGS